MLSFFMYVCFIFPVKVPCADVGLVVIIGLLCMHGSWGNS